MTVGVAHSTRAWYSRSAIQRHPDRGHWYTSPRLLVHSQAAANNWICFMLLTGMRRLESGSLRWSDVDLEAKTVTLRGEVDGEGGFSGVKNHNGITLPISSVLAEILAARQAPAPLNEKVARRRRVQRSQEYVFSSNGKKTPFMTNAQATFEALTIVAGGTWDDRNKRVHAHSLRRSFEDCAQSVRIDSDTRRLLLNHISGDTHAIHYANGVQGLAEAVEAIAKYVTDAALAAESSNVLPFPTKKMA